MPPRGTMTNEDQVSERAKLDRPVRRSRIFRPVTMVLGPVPEHCAPRQAGSPLVQAAVVQEERLSIRARN